MSKRQRARVAAVNALQRAIEGSRKLPEADRKRVQGSIDECLVNFQRAIAPAFHWRALADAYAVAWELSEIGICSDEASRQKLMDGELALGLVWRRWNEKQSWTLYADELLLLADGLWLHKVQLDYCSMREYQQAIDRVKRKMQQALAGNVPPGTIVLGGDDDNINATKSRIE